MIKYIEILL